MNQQIHNVVGAVILLVIALIAIGFYTTQQESKEQPAPPGGGVSGPASSVVSSPDPDRPVFSIATLGLLAYRHSDRGRSLRLLLSFPNELIRGKVPMVCHNGHGLPYKSPTTLGCRHGHGLVSRMRTTTLSYRHGDAPAGPGPG